MKNDTIIVLADSSDPQFAKLRESFPNLRIAVGNPVDLFKQGIAEARVLFNWSGSLDLIRGVFRMCPDLLWVHSRSVGLERSLFPELVESPVVLTNGVGVFSPALGEFVLAAILYFAKDFRRMIRNQMASVWEQFDVQEIAGQTVGILGYGDIG